MRVALAFSLLISQLTQKASFPRHVASLAVKMQEMGMSEDNIRSNLDVSHFRHLEDRNSALGSESASSGSAHSRRLLDQDHIEWSAHSRRLLGASSGSSLLDQESRTNDAFQTPWGPPAFEDFLESDANTPPISAEKQKRHGMVRQRLVELANAGGYFTQNLLRKYSHLVRNDVFVGRYLESRQDNIEVTARKVSCL